jgi:hypothetical protein
VELGGDHAGRIEAEALTIEGQRSFEIVHRECDHMDPRVHNVLLSRSG